MKTPTQNIKNEVLIPGDSYSAGAVTGGWVTRGTAEKALLALEVSNVGASGTVGTIKVQYRKLQADGTFGTATDMLQKDGVTPLAFANVSAAGAQYADLHFNESPIGCRDQFRLIATVATNAVKLSANATLVEFAELPPTGGHTNAFAAVHGPQSREVTAQNTP